MAKTKIVKKPSKTYKEKMIIKMKNQLSKFNIKFDKFLFTLENLIEHEEAVLVISAPNKTSFTIDITKLKKSYKYGYKDNHKLEMMLYIIYTIFEFKNCSCTYIVFLNQKYKEKEFRKIYGYTLRINDYNTVIYNQLRADDIYSAFSNHAEYNKIELNKNDIYCGYEKEDMICSFDK